MSVEDFGPTPPTTATATTRKKNRWGDGIPTPAAGARDFFPPGWTPTRDVSASIKVTSKHVLTRQSPADQHRFAAQEFGSHDDAALAKTIAAGTTIASKLIDFGVSITASHGASIYAYTEETSLYGKLNRTCRTSGARHRTAAASLPGCSPS